MATTNIPTPTQTKQQREEERSRQIESALKQGGEYTSKVIEQKKADIASGKISTFTAFEGGQRVTYSKGGSSGGGSSKQTLTENRAVDVVQTKSGAMSVPYELQTQKQQFETQARLTKQSVIQTQQGKVSKAVEYQRPQEQFQSEILKKTGQQSKVPIKTEQQKVIESIQSPQGNIRIKQQSSVMGKLQGVAGVPFKVGELGKPNSYLSRAVLTFPTEIAEGFTQVANPLNVAYTQQEVIKKVNPIKTEPFSDLFKDVEKVGSKINLPKEQNIFIPQDLTKSEKAGNVILLGSVAGAAVFVPETIPFIETAGLYFTGKSIFKAVKNPTAENVGEAGYSALLTRTPAYLKEGFIRASGQYRPEIITVQGFPKEVRPATVQRLIGQEQITVASSSGLKQPIYAGEPSYAGTKGTPGFFGTPQTTTVKVAGISEPVPVFRTGTAFLEPGRTPNYWLNQIKAMSKGGEISRGKTPNIQPVSILDWKLRNPTVTLSTQKVVVPETTSNIKSFYREVQASGESTASTIAPKTLRDYGQPEFETFQVTQQKGFIEDVSSVQIGKTKTGANVIVNVPKETPLVDLYKLALSERFKSYKLQVAEKEIQAKELAEWSKTKYDYIQKGSPLGDMIDNSGRIHQELVAEYATKISKQTGVEVDKNVIQAFAEIHDIYKQKTINYKEADRIAFGVEQGYYDYSPAVKSLTPEQKTMVARAIRIDEKPPINIPNLQTRTKDTLKYSLDIPTDAEKVLINADRFARFGNKADPSMIFKIEKRVQSKQGNTIASKQYGKEEFVNALNIKTGTKEIKPIKEYNYDYGSKPNKLYSLSDNKAVDNVYKEYSPKEYNYDYVPSKSKVITTYRDYNPKEYSELSKTNETYKVVNYGGYKYKPETPNKPTTYEPNKIKIPKITYDYKKGYDGSKSYFNKNPDKRYDSNYRRGTIIKNPILNIPNKQNIKPEEFKKPTKVKYKYGKQKESKYVIPDLLSTSITEQETFKQKGFKGEQAISPTLTKKVKSLAYAERAGVSIGGYIPTEQLRKRARF